MQVQKHFWSILKRIQKTMFFPRWKWLLWLLGFGVWWHFFLLPDNLFLDPVSTVIKDRNGQLLGARIADDGQWRFPGSDTVPEKFAKAITTFEDNHFYIHPGVDLAAFARAMSQNIRNASIVSGGSTITMQVMRMSRKGKPRSLWQKMVEATLAIRSEMRYTKSQILAMYANNAPFGGNIVGLEAAAWRYFGRGPENLSWAEAATLAVLPNAPGLIHPGRNRSALKAKRNRLLIRMREKQVIDSITCHSAMQEPLPERPHPLPDFAPHLIDRIKYETRENKSVVTTLDIHLQERASTILQQHQRRLLENSIHNSAALIIEVESGDVLAYIGNTLPEDGNHGHDVDIIRSRRSTGSILKPFLFASMLDEGEILPNTLVPDIPTYYGAYKPQNYNRTFDGAVPAQLALARSLNIPAIRMLSDYGHQRFLLKLRELGMTTVDRSAEDYGLSLILGGAEASLWELASIYSSMARSVNDFHRFNGKYVENEFRSANFELNKSITNTETYAPKLSTENPLSAAACYQTLDALLELTRPEGESEWRNFSSSRRIGWKTGTSFGFRDAWAIGVTPTHVVAVWAGNADGEGRPGLIGLHAAAPIMFDLFDLLHTPNIWFDKPFDDMEEITVCKQSGHRASNICDQTEIQYIPRRGLNTNPCPYHQMIHLDETGQFQVHSDCEAPSNMIHKAWFILPPSEEEWYRRKHVDYASLPPWRADCKTLGEAQSIEGNMEFIYPRTASKVYVPIDLNGNPSSVVFEIAHRKDDSKVYWHLDQNFVGTTEKFHQMAFNPAPGFHTVTLVDESGERLQKSIEVIAKDQ